MTPPGSPIAFSAAGTPGVASAGKGRSARPKLEHAYLELRTPPSGGGLTPGAPCGRIEFQFNPKEFRVVASAAVVEMLLDEESQHLAGLSDFVGKPVSLQTEPSMSPEQYDIVLL